MYRITSGYLPGFRALHNCRTTAVLERQDSTKLALVLVLVASIKLALNKFCKCRQFPAYTYYCMQRIVHACTTMRKRILFKATPGTMQACVP